MARWLPRRTRRSVAVHTSDGRSLSGILLAVHRDVVVLAHAKVLDDAGQPVAVDGDVAIPRARVAFVQVLPVQEAP
jgi:hypothetical protein